MKSEELYVKAKKCSIETAITECERIRTQIKNKKPDIEPEQLESTLFMLIKKSMTTSGDKANVVLVAIGPEKDSKFPAKRKALNQFEKNPSCAILTEALEKVRADPTITDMSKIYVRIDPTQIDSTGKPIPIPIDNQQFYGKSVGGVFVPDTSRKNPNFLEDIATEMIHEAVFITEDGACVPGQGKFDPTALPKPGDIANITGRVTKNDEGVVTKIQVYQKGWKSDKKLTDIELWDFAYQKVGESDISVPIEEVWDREPYTMVAICGKVTSATVMKQGSGGPAVTITDIGLDQDINCYGDENHLDLKAQMDNIVTGTECIVFGSVNKYTAKDGTPKQVINMIGILCNPTQSDFTNIMQDVEDIDI